MDLRSAILSYRAIHHISQTEFARLCGLSYQTINSLENGYQRPSKVTMAKLIMVINEKREVDIEKWAKEETNKLKPEVFEQAKKEMENGC